MDVKRKLISEELKRFQLLNEFDFYTPKSLNEEDPEEGDEDVEGGPAPDGAEGGEMPDDNMGDFDQQGGGEEDIDGGPAPDGAEGDFPDDMEGEDIPGVDDPEMGGTDVPPVGEPEEDVVEVDITDLMQNSEEEKQKINQLDARLSQTQQILQNIENSFSKMSDITAKIDSLESEFEKRNPTNQEKLELKSLQSYPYNIKLTDYWGNKEGNYDAMGQEHYKKEPEEYVLTQKDVDDDYSEVGIAKTF